MNFFLMNKGVFDRIKLFNNNYLRIAYVKKKSFKFI